MNENRPTIKTKPKKYISNDGLYVQALLSAFVVILSIMSIFIKVFTIPNQIMLSLLLFTMAYNNETSYAKEHMTIVYVVLGFLILLFTILSLFI